MGLGIIINPVPFKSREEKEGHSHTFFLYLSHRLNTDGTVTIGYLVFQGIRILLNTVEL